jgi:hypothetical protein
VITAHSCDLIAELQVVDDPNAPTDPALSEAVLAALAEAALAAPQRWSGSEADTCRARV